MRKAAIALTLGLISGMAYADEITEIYSDCITEHNDNYFYISTGFDIRAKTHAKIDVLGYKFNETQKYKFDAPNIAAGIDVYGVAVGANVSWRDVDGMRMRNITSILELPILPFAITPYAIGEIGITDVKFDDAHFHDRGFIYGGGIGMRINISDNTFIKVYEIWSRTRLRDSISDVPVKISARHSRAGVAIGYLF